MTGKCYDFRVKLLKNSIVREQESPDECRPMYFNKEKYEKM